MNVVMFGAQIVKNTAMWLTNAPHSKALELSAYIVEVVTL